MHRRLAGIFSVPTVATLAAALSATLTLHADNSPARHSTAAIVATLRSALASTNEEPAAASDGAIMTGDDVAHLGSASWSYHSTSPPAVCVSPRTTAQVSSLLRAASALNLAVVPRAGGTSLEGQTVPPRDARPVVVVDFQRMNRVVSVSAADMTADVEPGVGWEALNAALAPHGLVFPVDPGPGAQIGGMAGTNCSGTRACRHGSFKNNVLGLEAVAADGTVFRTGSHARKTSAGLDLTSLLVGAEGSLAIITRATLRLAPAPAAIRVISTPFATTRDALAAAAAAVQAGVPLLAAEFMDGPMCGAVGAGLLKDGAVPTVLWKLAAASDAALNADAALLRGVVDRAGARGWTEADADTADDLWEARKTALFSAGVARAHDVDDARVLTTDVCVPLSALPALLERFDAHERETRGASRVAVFAVAHAGDGNAHHFIVFAPSDLAEVSRARYLADWLAAEAIALNGTCTGEHGVGEGKLKFLDAELGPGNAAVSRTIKHALDPLNILNPGKKIL